MLRQLLCALTLALLTLAPQSAHADPALRGEWRGLATQNDGQNFSLRLRINAGGGSVDYPDLNCGGALVRLADHDGYEVFQEQLSYGGEAQGGTCIDRGIIVMRRAGTGAAWTWTGVYDGDTYTAWATLQR